MLVTRRAALQELAASLAVTFAAGAAHATPKDPALDPRHPFAALERRSGGRLGVAVVDASGALREGHRADERFPMCSTFKVLAAAAVLARVDRGQERLDRRIAFGAADLLEYAPVTRARAAEGSLPLLTLCEAAVTVSDNTAANLLLESLGGPAQLTAYVRTLGDSMTRLDRNEPSLNECLPGDERDTTSPRAMARTFARLLLGPALSRASRERLARWMSASQTGLERLRAGVPPSWRAGDKTGSGHGGTTNDVAVLWPPERPPIVIAAYLTQTTADTASRNGVLADVARFVTARR